MERASSRAVVSPCALCVCALTRSLVAVSSPLSALSGLPIVQLFEHDRRCFYWENWLVLLVLTAYVLMYTLIKNRVINIFDKCDVGWWVW